MKSKQWRNSAVSGAVFLLMALGLPVTDAGAEADSWPQWRGPSRDGGLSGQAFPASLEGLREVWRVGLGPSYSGPIVTPDRVFITETAGGDTEVVRALSRSTGEELWRASWPGQGSVPFFAKKNGDWIRSTPTYDGSSLFVGGMNEILVALDGESGKELWRLDFPRLYGTPVPPFGFASSPLVGEEAVFIQAATSLVKVEKKTGKVLWRSAEETGGIASQGAFSSPVFATFGGRPQVVMQSRTTLYGVDSADGEVLWSQPVPHFRGCNILTPMIVGDAVFTSGYQNGSFLFRVRSAEGKFSVEEVWTGKESAYMSSPIVLEDHAYVHLGNGRLSAIDLSTGKSRWTSSSFGKYWSMVTRGGRVLALDERGELVLFQASPERFELLDRRQVTESEAWAYLAVVGDELFIRDQSSVAAYRWTVEPKPATQTQAR